eukprot:scaffold82447_cov52-Attheya_sp.AAC.1
MAGPSSSFSTAPLSLRSTDAGTGKVISCVPSPENSRDEVSHDNFRKFVRGAANNGAGTNA